MMRRLSIFVLGAIVLGGWAFAQDTGERELRPRRLYFGSPPATPHAITRAMTNCLSCHGESATFAPKSPHPTRVQCRQCHVEGVNASPPFRNSSFVGLRPPDVSGASNGLAPPMAHTALLRETCLTCHSPGARREVVSTPHPERPACQTCHSPW